jgi:molybdopterin converting factor small subunit
MRVTVHYLAQIKRAAGCNFEHVDSLEGATLREFLRALAERHDSPFRSLLLDDVGEPRKSLLFFVGDQHVEVSQSLSDGDALMILAPMSGG